MEGSNGEGRWIHPCVAAMAAFPTTANPLVQINCTDTNWLHPRHRHVSFWLQQSQETQGSLAEIQCGDKLPEPSLLFPAEGCIDSLTWAASPCLFSHLGGLGKAQPTAVIFLRSLRDLPLLLNAPVSLTPCRWRSSMVELEPAKTFLPLSFLMVTVIPPAPTD